ncbi:hypothetical protein PC128_g19304 [Phytophthora cactorum]|nr:hypothetical protein PC128_g19304 [Phytophthora cactorum]
MTEPLSRFLEDISSNTFTVQDLVSSQSDFGDSHQTREQVSGEAPPQLL